MSANDKEIRRKWQQFKIDKQKKTNRKDLIYVKKEDISKIFKGIFG
jgi:hypothetical protein